MSWTPEEFTELRKLAIACDNATQAVRRAGQGVTQVSDKDATVELMLHMFRGLFDLRGAISGLLSSESNSDPGRDAEVRLFRRGIDNAVEHFQDASNTAAPLAVSSARMAQTRDLLDLAITNLNDIDLTLGYVDFQSEEFFPKVVGPHGDFEIAQRNLEHMTQYTLHCMHDAARYWQNTSIPLTGNMSNTFRDMGEALGLMFRTWLMDGDIYTPSEQAVIEADEASASGRRPFSFHRLVRESELLFNNANVPNHGGRIMITGATVFVRKFADAFTLAKMLHASTHPEEFIVQHNRRRGNLGNVGPDGWGSEFHFDLHDFWTDLDGVGHAWFGFHHEIPDEPGNGGPPPPPDPCPEFELITTQIGNTVTITMQEVEQ